MNWKVDFSSSSLQFLKQNNIDEDSILGKIKLALRKFQGEGVNLDIKKLKGQ